MQPDPNREHQQQGQEGSGSAENTGKDRAEQKARLVSLTDTEKEDIAAQAGLQPDDIIDVQQTGALRGGRDDLAGGSGDRMEETSSDEPTDRT